MCLLVEPFHFLFKGSSRIVMFTSVHSICWREGVKGRRTLFIMSFIMYIAVLIQGR